MIPEGFGVWVGEDTDGAVMALDTFPLSKSLAAVPKVLLQIRRGAAHTPFTHPAPRGELLRAKNVHILFPDG